MPVIKLRENIPKDGAGREYPYLACTKVIGIFPIDAAIAERGAKLTIEVVPYRLIMDGDIPVRIPHPAINQSIDLPDFSPLNNESLVALAAQIIRGSVNKWASAEVIDG